MRYAILPDRALLSVSGEDADEFLQGLISNDIKKLSLHHPLYAALLSPQGKYLHDFILVRLGHSILIDCERHREQELLQRLSMYKLRSKVAVAKAPDLVVVVAWGEGSSPLGFADPRLPQLGFRIIGQKDDVLAQCKNAGWQEATQDDYDQLRIDLGVPDGSRDLLVDKTFLLEAHFEALHGVDFHKGCYVGQEVTARSKFRGQVRKSFYRVQATQSLPEPGTPVLSGALEIGQLRSHAGGQGIALLRIEETEAAMASGAALEAAGQKIEVFSPAWLAAKS